MISLNKIVLSAFRMVLLSLTHAHIPSTAFEPEIRFNHDLYFDDSTLYWINNRANICYSVDSGEFRRDDECYADRLEFDAFTSLSAITAFLLFVGGLCHLATHLNPPHENVNEVPDEPRIYDSLNALLATDKLSTTAGISKHLREYLASIEKNPIRPKKLTPEQDDIFSDHHDELICPISCRIMDMPVTIYEVRYDFSSVIALAVDENGCREHPETREKFTLLEVQADRKTRELIVNRLNEKHPELHTKFPAYFSRQGVDSRKISWKKVEKSLKNQDEKRSTALLTQLRDYSKEHHIVNIENKSIEALKRFSSASSKI